MKFISVFFCSIIFIASKAQPTKPIVVKDAIANNKALLYKNMLNNGITKNVSTPLADSTEQNWMHAFNTIALLQYQSPWINNQIQIAVTDLPNRSNDFKMALLQLLYSNYPTQYATPILQLLQGTTLPNDVFALATEYVYKALPTSKQALLQLLAKQQMQAGSNLPLQQLVLTLNNGNSTLTNAEIKKVLLQPFFKNAVVVFSLQRSNRNYPGLAIVKDTAGNFLKDINGFTLAIPQLAKSINNLPFYCSNGNTPQGIFKMQGTAISRINFIGPTPNIQLKMPCEIRVQDFFNDSTLTDSVWTMELYNKLLPTSLQYNTALVQTFIASVIGRTQIIAHGTTINPAYYKLQPFYPLTPTQGCLCCKEIWSEADGTIVQSDQQKLHDAIQKAGGANGYLIVLDISNDNRAVSIEDIERLLITNR
jgi:hypothetical protein